MSEEINEIFKQWKQFLSWCYENNDKTTEIHRDNLEKVMAYTRQLENIMKEIREYIEENTNSDSFTELTSGKITDIGYCIVAFEDFLEILDKVDKEKE